MPLLDKLFEGSPAQVSAPLTGNELKRSNMRSVFRHTPDWYREAFRSAVQGFPRGKTFTVEDIREIAGDPPDSVSSNCMGSLMMMVAKEKLAKKTGHYVKAKRRCMNATDLACWVRV